ncbi:MAG: T9SS type A sorting domain-containing protein, partial [Ignavibacteriaceae bacterium]
FDNADNLIIDGRPGGIGESIGLTIQNLDTSGSAILVTNDSKNIVITHCKILGSSVSENKGVVEFSFSDFNLSSDNVTISNCYIGKSITGRPANCFYFGSTSYGGISYWKISGCSITDFTSIGVNFETGSTATIEDCEIFLTDPSPKNKVSGIKMIEPVSSLRIEKNKIHSLSSSLSSTNFITGIEIPFSSYHDIMNNFISLSGNEYSQVTGIDYSGAYASYDSIFNNTIYIYGNSINEQNSYCFRRRAHQYYGGLSLRMKNNILINKRNNTQGFGWHYAIAIEDERGFHQLDYNNYYSFGTGSVLGRWLSYDVTSINEWRSFTQKDEHSISKNVNFISQNDLHLTGTSLGDEDLTAQPNSLVQVDIDNEPRNLYFPYMGADESTDYPLPVELAGFTATVFANKTTLNWSTASELNNSGFEIEKSFYNEKSKSFMEWKTIGFVPGKGTAVSKQEYSYIDDEEIFCKTAYRLKQIDFDGSYTNSFLVEVAPQLPKEFSISQNYPNPFNPGTVINYQLPVNSKVIIKVYDILGNEIATLVNEVKPAGKYEVNFNATQFTSGVYLYKIQAGNYIETKKMILIK